MLACTDTDAVPKPLWRPRKEAYVAGVATKPADALLVTMADKLHNTTSILEDHRVVGEAVWSRFDGGRDGTLWYYRALADAFEQQAPGPLADRIDRAVSALEGRADP